MLKHFFIFFHKLRHLSIILLGLTYLVSVNVSASTDTTQPPIKFDRLTVADGLSQNSTYSITQDQQGFIWIATQDGLNRYDGEHFVQYRKNNSDPNSIADNFIRKVFIDNTNTLWVGTENGLSKYNRKTDNFENFYTSTDDSNTLSDNLIWDIYQDNNGMLLVSTEAGLHKYNNKDNHFVRIRFRGFENKLTAIKTIFQDHNNNYWLGTFENGIYISNSKFQNTFSLQENNPWQLNIPVNKLLDIKRVNNDYWLGTDNGVYIIDPDYQQKHQVVNELTSNFVRSIEPFNDNETWIGTQNGLNRINNFSYQIEHIEAHNHPKSLSNNWIMDIFTDDNKNTWFASYEGLNYINNQQFLLTHHLFNYQNNNTQVESIAETTNGNLWFRTNYIVTN